MATSNGYHGSTFREVRDQVFSDPYVTLPYHEITLASFYGGMRNLLLQACRRALTEKRDLVEPFQRLVHPVGIALTGRWKMTQDSPYTGLLRPGTETLIVVRCSVLLYKTLQGQYRGFAFAGKLFPTLDEEERVETVDFFTIDVLAGTLAKYFTGVELSNRPPLGFNSDVLRLFWVVTATFATFIIANLNPVMRPVYPLAEHGLKKGEVARMPRWMMVRGWAGSGRVDTPDFRDELRVEGYKDGRLIFEVFAADTTLPNGQRDYKKLGDITLTESVTSASCDHRLKFRHPVLKDQPVL
ncbi:MAG TPA: hypothetical protein VIA62_16220 [Thermoanaerobaculia bacterium]|jgi:hypothetical protein|nr:hypothetical protein [Thermoanaerobaculia bacterium]